MLRLDKALLVCPTLNPGDTFEAWLSAYNCQKEKPASVLIIDSSSDDGSVAVAEIGDFTVNVIDREEFNHGGTRQKAIVENEQFDYIIFLTQDAVLADTNALKNIVLPFEDDSVAAVCGRQLPNRDAGAIAAHARIFNYRETSFVRSFADRETFGIKTAFMSNSFAAYRVSAFNEVGGFPKDVIFGEDMYVAAKLLIAGYKIAYAADACVYHSHNYSLWQEFKRYFDMGVFHAHEPWIRLEFGGAEGEALRFVVSELKYLLTHAFWRMPEAILRTLFRYTGFRLGLLEKRLPQRLKRQLTMNKGYFK